MKYNSWLWSAKKKLRNRVIISAPFGNYLRLPWATPTLGTFTVQNRGGFWKRLWRVLCTVRYNFAEKSWVNRLGLPNPGINALKSVIRGQVHRAADPSDCIVSVHGFNVDEWKHLLDCVSQFGCPLELNLSCPNVEKEVVRLPSLHEYPGQIIAKLSPVGYLDFGMRLFDAGVRCFHLCNTLPCKEGGKSGKPLMPYSLRAVYEFRNRFGNEIEIIGGGGITCLADVQEYVRAGVDRVAVGSMLFNPMRWMLIKTFSDYMERID